MEPLACVVRGVERSRIGKDAVVAVIGTGPIGLLLVGVASLSGAHVIAVGRRESRLERSRTMGARGTVVVREGDDFVARVREATPRGEGPDVVVEAVGLTSTSAGALACVRKGGLVNLFAGCADGAELAVSAARLHYEEISLVSSFHHTPSSLRRALAILSAGEIRPERVVTGQAGLEDLPGVLGEMGRGDALKTAILPW